MNQQEFKDTMDEIRLSDQDTARIWEAIRQQDTPKPRRTWKKGVLGAWAIIGVVILGGFLFVQKTEAVPVIKEYTLESGGDKVEIGLMGKIDFKAEAFMNSDLSQIITSSDQTTYFADYGQDKKSIEKYGISLIENGQIKEDNANYMLTYISSRSGIGMVSDLAYESGTLQYTIYFHLDDLNKGINGVGGYQSDITTYTGTGGLKAFLLPDDQAYVFVFDGSMYLVYYQDLSLDQIKTIIDGYPSDTDQE